MTWKDKINTVWQGDCLELMSEMPDKCIDLVVTSPPYDKLRDYQGFNFDFKTTATELLRIIKIGGVIVWIVNDQTINGSKSGTSFKQALFFKEIGFNLHDVMIWEKDTFSFPDPTRYRAVFEYIFILSKGKPKTINLIEDHKNKTAGTSVHGTSRGIDGKTFRKSNHNKKLIKEIGVRFNVWHQENEKKNVFNHPAPFPIKLAKELTISWSNENDLIFDPFMGSWTTARAAMDLGRNFIGSELSAEYCEIGKQRLRQQVLL